MWMVGMLWTFNGLSGVWQGKEFRGSEKGTTRLVICSLGRSPYTTFNTINETINIVDPLFSKVKIWQQSLAWFGRTR